MPSNTAVLGSVRNKAYAVDVAVCEWRCSHPSCARIVGRAVPVGQVTAFPWCCAHVQLRLGAYMIIATLNPLQIDVVWVSGKNLSTC